MAIRKIARMGHPILRRKAEPIPIEDITSSQIQNLIRDMFETVLDADGRGLAAPQIHESKRIVILEIQESEGFQVWINPVLQPLTEECMLTFEGCLSVPEMRAAVVRPSKVQVDAFNEKGEPISMILEDFPAVVAQHECDHLDGILYIDRMEPGTLSFLEEYHRYAHLYDFSEEEE